MKHKLLPVQEVLRRRRECEVLLEEGSWQPAVVVQREFGPIRLGSGRFVSEDARGRPSIGSKVVLPDSKNEWRVLRVFDEGKVVKVELRCGMVKIVRDLAKGYELRPFRVEVYSIDGQAFRITSSDIAEPPLRQSKACYWDARVGFYRILLPEEGWLLMGKPARVLERWRTRAAEEAADASLPKTVPPYAATHIWSLAGNSIAQAMAALVVEEFVSRYCTMRRLLDDGSVTLEPGLPASGDDLYDEPALRWRARTLAAENFVSKPPDKQGIDDSYLDVTVRRKDEESDRTADDLAVERLQEAAGAATAAGTRGDVRARFGGGLCDGAGPSGAPPLPSAPGAKTWLEARVLPFGPKDRPWAADWEQARQMLLSCSAGSDPSELLGGSLAKSAEDLESLSLDGGSSDDGSDSEAESEAEVGIHEREWRRPTAEEWGKAVAAREALGARRVSARPRAPRQTFKPAPSMRGGASSWREGMSAEAEPEAKVVTIASTTSKSTKGSAKPMPASSSRVSVRKFASKPKARAAARDSKEAAGEEEIPRPSFAAVAPGNATAATAKVRTAKNFGPLRPKKLPVKGKRQHGIAVASLEMQKLFAQGDWDAIADYATYRLPMYSVAWSTLKGYESSWKHWVSFQYRAQLPIFLRTSNAFERSLCSKWLLSFIALLAFAVGFKPSTIKKCLMAIRFFHLAHDYENPLEKCPRVWQGYKSIKRMVGATERKFPITPEMLDWLDETSATQGLAGTVKRARNKFGVYLACRSSEYIGPDVHWDKVMLTTDVRPLKGQAYCDWDDDFDGIMARFRGSKTDQYNEGCMRYVGRTGNSRCLMAELHRWVELQPGHFDVTDECVPLFTMPNGKISARAELQGDLRAAAVACGVDESRIGTHSLRVTCATWLYQAGYDLEYIKRHGRWVSNVVHVYLWEGSGFHDMSKRMSEVKFTLHAMM